MERRQHCGDIGKKNGDGERSHPWIERITIQEEPALLQGKIGEWVETGPGQLFNPNDFACPSSLHIFVHGRKGVGCRGS